MVFVSKNLIRKCKWCEKEPAKNFCKRTGRFKGYYRTCGDLICRKAAYEDHYVCVLKGRKKISVKGICDICGASFLARTANHKRFCLTCVPDHSWRGRAARYLIGKPQWEALLKDQEFKCALCDRNPEVVDHCHNEGTVRGLLCGRCNGMIRLVDCDSEYIKKVFKYAGVKYSI